MMTAPVVVMVLVGEMRGIIFVIGIIEKGEGQGAAVQIIDKVGAGVATIGGTKFQ